MKANVRYHAMMMLACLLVATSMRGQSDLVPVIVSPLIGDTLDREEYEYYRFRIRPEVLKDFHHACFLMAPDGMLTIKVTSTVGEGNTIDSLIPTRLTRSMVESGLRLALQENKEGRDWGREVTVFPAHGGELEGELLAVDGDGIVLSLTDEATDSDLAGGVAASRRFPLGPDSFGRDRRRVMGLQGSAHRDVVGGGDRLRDRQDRGPTKHYQLRCGDRGRSRSGSWVAHGRHHWCSILRA